MRLHWDPRIPDNEGAAAMGNQLIDHYRDFPAEEYAGRIARLRQRLPAAELDAVLITSEPNIRWLVGYHTLLALKAMPLAAVIPADPSCRSVFLCATDATGSDLAVGAQRTRRTGGHTPVPGRDIQP
jgi:hypothetical protein